MTHANDMAGFERRFRAARSKDDALSVYAELTAYIERDLAELRELQAERTARFPDRALEFAIDDATAAAALNWARVSARDDGQADQ